MSARARDIKRLRRHVRAAERSGKYEKVVGYLSGRYPRVYGFGRVSCAILTA